MLKTEKRMEESLSTHLLEAERARSLPTTPLHTLSFAETFRSKPMSGRAHVFTTVLGLAMIAGCAAQPQVSMHESGPMKHYAVLQVPAATNDTGKTFDFDPAAVLTDDLRAELSNRGLSVSDGTQPSAGQDALIVKCSIVSYQPGSPIKAWLAAAGGAAQVTVKSTLIDQQSGNVVGTMITPASFAAGLYGYTMSPEKVVLSSAAKGIAQEVATRINSQ